MAFAILVEALNLIVAARRAKREERRQRPVGLRPRYADVDESIAVHTALEGRSSAGSVGLSKKPVEGAVDSEASGVRDERSGLG